MVTLAVRFDRQTGRGMYHCHILDHEDGGMMRPLVVLPPTVLTVQNMTMAMNMSAFNPAIKSGMAAMPSMKGGMDAMPGMGH
jgi:spore coat protein A